jgi:hypothetical protein
MAAQRERDGHLADAGTAGDVLKRDGAVTRHLYE